MNNEKFQAQEWLGLAAGNLFPPQTATELKEDNFSLRDWFVPGWSGESLISKDAITLKKGITNLWSDSIKKFNTFERQTKKFKNSIFNEFIAFLNSRSESSEDFLNFDDFWKHYRDKDSQYYDLTVNFTRIYCYRSVIVYLFKIRFLIKLTNNKAYDVNENTLLNPLSFFTKTFRMGSSTELFSKALIKTHQYSWYRPSQEYSIEIKKLSTSLLSLSTSEIMKVFTSQPDLKNVNKLEFNDPDYSHTLSHKTFGKFINDLILTFPKLIKREEDQLPSFLSNLSSQVEVINCKYFGDYLNSFSLSHWVAQENKLGNNWVKVISPDFINIDFHNGPFLKICQELQFLTFLLNLSHELEKEPIDFISSIMRRKNSHSVSSSGQMAFFSEIGPETCEKYNRVVGNLSRLPKNNPHHFLMSKINTEIESLYDDGYLYIFTNQNLFISSQSEKIESLLKSARVEAYFNFEELKGRGEIPNYLYIFSKKKKRENKTKISFLINEQNESSKEPCLSFRMKGTLHSFHNFSLLVKETKNFLRNKKTNFSPVFLKEIDEDLIFEFNQDAIVEGKILHSVSSDPNNITHPHFFRNLTNKCVPLDQFFSIDNLSGPTHQKRSSLTTGLLGINIEKENDFPYILIVNLSDPRNINLEIISSESYTAKKEEYGTAYYFYFSLVPKIADLNINVFREYFGNHLGHQIIQLCLNEGGSSKLKAKLKRLLIPKFFGECLYSPKSFPLKFELLKSNTIKILQIHPEKLKKEYNEIEHDLLSYAKEYPWQIMSILSFFKNNIEKAHLKVDGMENINKIEYIPFLNPLIIEELKSLKLNPLFPSNDDVYIEFQFDEKDDFNQGLLSKKLQINNENSTLTLVSKSGGSVIFHSEPIMLRFIDFILDSAEGYPLIEILQNLSVPSLKKLQSGIQKACDLEESLKSIHQSLSRIILQILSQQISTPGGY